MEAWLRLVLLGARIKYIALEGTLAPKTSDFKA